LQTPLTAFGMRCRGYDPYLETWPAGVERVAAGLAQRFEPLEVVDQDVPLRDRQRLRQPVGAVIEMAGAVSAAVGPAVALAAVG